MNDSFLQPDSIKLKHLNQSLQVFEMLGGNLCVELHFIDLNFSITVIYIEGLFQS